MQTALSKFLRSVLGALLWAVLLPCPEARAEAFTVAFYNLENYVLAEDASGEAASPATRTPAKSEDSLSALVEVICSVSPDVLGVCELGGDAMLEDLRARLKAAGLEFSDHVCVDGEDPIRHIGLLSKFPLIANNSLSDVPFDLGGQRFRVQRGILDVTLRVVPGFDLRLIGVHLKSRRSTPAFDQAQFRAKEAWHVRNHLDQILKEAPETKLLLFGDLNDTKNEYPIRELIGTRGTPIHMVDLGLADARGERWTHYWQTADSYARIDYLMASPALVPHLDLGKSGICDHEQWNLASDHRLIFTTINEEPHAHHE